MFVKIQNVLLFLKRFFIFKNVFQVSSNKLCIIKRFLKILKIFNNIFL
mgnify:CR=1 FL=1